MKPVLFSYIDVVVIESSALKRRYIYNLISVNVRRVLLNLCFRDALLIIRRVLTITRA